MGRRGRAPRIEEWTDPDEEPMPRTRRLEINPDEVRAMRRVLDDMRNGR